MNERVDFLDLNVRLFHNKKNGQISIALPKKKLNEIITNKKMPNNMNIRIFRWK